MASRKNWLQKKISLPSEIKIPNFFKKSEKPEEDELKDPHGLFSGHLAVSMPRRSAAVSGSMGGYKSAAVTGSMGGYNQACVYLADPITNEVVTWGPPPWEISSPPKIYEAFGVGPNERDEFIRNCKQSMLVWCDDLAKSHPHLAENFLDDLMKLKTNDFAEGNFANRR